jgi:hypothetical protein
MAGRQQYQHGGISQHDRTAFAQAVLEVLEAHGDVASELTWQRLSKVIAEYWLVFQTDQSPLSTWNMLTRCAETVLRIRAFGAGRGAGSGADALEEFRSFMGEVLGERPGKTELPE